MFMLFIILKATKEQKQIVDFVNGLAVIINTFIRGWQRQLTSVRLFIRENKPFTNTVDLNGADENMHLLFFSLK